MNDLSDVLFGFIMICFGIFIGVFLVPTKNNEFTKPLQPTIVVKCNTIVCDTTYIYNFNVD